MLEEDKVTKDRQNRRQERDEIQIAEDRCNHLPGQGEGEAGAVACRGRGRSREGERERKFKGIVEKIKRKLDGDLELTQEGRPSLPWSVSKPTCTRPACARRSRCPPWLPSSRTRRRWACSTGPRR